MTFFTLHRRQAGFGAPLLLGAALSLIAMAILAKGHLQDIQAESDAKKADLQVAQFTILKTGLDGYISQNFKALQEGTAVTGVANAYAPTLAELSAGNYVDNTLLGYNLYGSSYQTQISKVPSGCLLNCKFSGLVWTSAPLKDSTGQPISGVKVGELVQKGGADYGFSLNVGNIGGYQAGWSAVNPVLGQPAGVVAVRYGYKPNTLYPDDFLKRDGTLPMTGDLDMGTHAIGSASDVTGSGLVKSGTLRPTALKTLGTACPNKGEMAQDAASPGAIIECKDNLWSKGAGASGAPFLASDAMNAYRGVIANLAGGDKYLVTLTSGLMYYTPAGVGTSLCLINTQTCSWFPTFGSLYTKVVATLTGPGLLLKTYSCDVSKNPACQQNGSSFYPWTSHL